MGLKVKDLIKALQKFPQEWEICLGEADNDESRPIKGIMDCSETDDMGYPIYEFVEIQALEYLDLFDLTEGKVEMYGDRNWYNTKDTHKKHCSDGSKIEYRLTHDGRIDIISCKNCKGEDILLGDVSDENQWGEWWNKPVTDDKFKITELEDNETKEHTWLISDDTTIIELYGNGNDAERLKDLLNEHW